MKYFFTIITIILSSLTFAQEPLQCDDDGANIYVGQLGNGTPYVWASTNAGRMFNNRLRLNKGTIYLNDIQQQINFSQTSFDFIDSFMYVDGAFLRQDCFVKYDIQIQFNRMYISFVFENTVVELKYSMKPNNWRK